MRIEQPPPQNINSSGSQPGKDTGTIKILVIIPAYNESGRISSVIKGVSRQLPGARILVIDDGSTDGTAGEAEDLGTEVIRLDRNRGYGEALQAGYRFALENGVDIVIQLDADGQHEPESIPSLLAELNRTGADIVIGSRFHANGEYRMPPARRLGRGLFRFLLRMLTGRSFNDPTSGFQVIRKSTLLHCTSPDFPADYPDANAIYYLWKAGANIREAEAKFHPSPPGKKPLHRGVRLFSYIFKVFSSLIRTRFMTFSKGQEAGDVDTKD